MNPAHTNLPTRIERLAGDGPVRFPLCGSRIFFESQQVAISKDANTITTRLPLLPARVKRFPVEAGKGARWLPAAFGLPPRIELPFGSLRPLLLLDEQEASALVAALRAAATSALPPASGA